MKKDKLFRIQDLLGLLHGLYPTALAEEWDNVGLQVGDPAATVTRVLVALDPTEAALAEAKRQQAQVLLSHHPLLFRPLKKLTPQDSTGKILFTAIRDEIAVISAHTNLDRGENGLNDWLAARLGVEGTVPLASRSGEWLKLVVYLPKGYEAPVSAALFAAGAGRIGRYDQCSFRSEGVGTFRPGEECTPFVGSCGSRESVAELRLETILPKAAAEKALTRLRKAHPYEEIAYDLIPLLNREQLTGLGRIGRLVTKTTLQEFAETVRTALGCDHLRLVGDRTMNIAKVALCGGSGASLLHEAARQGADVLVTGDVKYHEARQAEELGLALIDAGHFASERLMVEGLCQTLRDAATKQKMMIDFVAMPDEKDPFEIL